MMTELKALLDAVQSKIEKESELSSAQKVELLDWVSGQSLDMVRFLSSDEFQYCETHLHTEKTLLDGVGTIKDYLKQARKLGHRALAVTDQAVTHNWFSLRSIESPVKNEEGEIVSEGLRPIFGCEVYVHFNEEIHNLILLAENTVGYRNILHIATESHANKSDESAKEPNISMETLMTYSEGVIATSACIDGVLGKPIRRNMPYNEVKAIAESFNNIFEGRFYLEVQDFETENEDDLEDFQLEFIEKQRRVNDTVVRLAEDLGLPLVATSNVHYPLKGDHLKQDVLLAIGAKDKLDNPDRLRSQSTLFYMKDKWEMLFRFKKSPEAVFNTWEIAKRCHVEYQEEYLLPDYPYLPEGMSANEFFKKSVRDGVKAYYSVPEHFNVLLEKFECTEEELWALIWERAKFEVEVLENMGFEGYMQIVSWINELARENNILIGPGRGSAAGSIVALALGITFVCPLRFDLLFERFLNPDRIEMPDIDMDYQYERRRELIELVANELGHDKVAQIVTFGKMKARAALRDVGRVLASPPALVDKLAKLIPFGKDIKASLEIVQEFKDEYSKNPDAKRLIDFALMVEGRPKNYSVHAAGIILSKDSIPNHAAFQVGKKAILPVIQAEMSDVDGLRLVKQDFLGLRTLSTEGMCIEFVKRRHGIIIDPYKIPKDDKKTYDLLASGQSIACFQLESSGMRQLLQDMQVDKLEDIVDCIALYRPGVLSVGMHNEYVKNKFNPNEIKYIHPLMEKVLAPTRGIMIYQEQAMLLANQLAGFSMAEADKLRKAIGKKKEDLMAKLKAMFVKGCFTTSNIPQDTAEEIWHLIEVMASYSFNKSHSVAYAFISVDTAYLKANYPIEYMCAAIALAAQAKSPKVPLYIEEAKRMGIKVYAPDINLSEVDFDIKNEGIVFGLRAIRNVGKSSALITAERNANGPFKSMLDFRKRVNINKTVLESLIKAGCFDSLGVNRFSLMAEIDTLVNIKPDAAKNKKNVNQMSLMLPDFEALEESLIEFPDIPGPTKEQIADIEDEMCGIYITHHPLASHKDAMDELISTSAEELVNCPEGALVTVGGLIKEKKVFLTKARKEEMARFSIDDLTGYFDVISFPKQYVNMKDFNEKDIVLIKGRVQYNERFSANQNEDEDDTTENETEYDVQIVAEEMIIFSTEKKEVLKRLMLQDDKVHLVDEPAPVAATNQTNTEVHLDMAGGTLLSLTDFLRNMGNPTVKVL